MSEASRIGADLEVEVAPNPIPRQVLVRMMSCWVARVIAT
jgi:hypothetical protein